MAGHRARRLVLSVTFAMLSGVLFFFYLTANSGERKEVVRKVAVAAKDIGAGQKITASMLTVKEVAESSLPNFALVNINEVVNKKATASIYRGELIHASRLSTEASKSGASRLIKKGKLAVVVQVDAFSTLREGIRPNDRVDVLAVEGSVNEKRESRLVCKNIRVIGLDDDGTFGKKEELLGARSLLSGRTIALETTEAEAKKITYAAETAKLKFALHSSEGEL